MNPSPARYIIRAYFTQERMWYPEQEGTVGYRSKASNSHVHPPHQQADAYADPEYSTVPFRVWKQAIFPKK
jgi:hypothetical protein